MAKRLQQGGVVLSHMERQRWTAEQKGTLRAPCVFGTCQSLTGLYQNSLEMENQVGATPF